MGANSFFIDILLFGELMRPLTAIRYPLSVSYVPVCCIPESKGGRSLSRPGKATMGQPPADRVLVAERAGAEGVLYAAEGGI